MNPKFQIVSDLHFDINKDYYFEQTDADILVIAGDTAEFNNLDKALRALKEKYEYPYILFIPGNHEYYGCFDGIIYADAYMRDLCDHYGIKFMNKDVTTIHEVTIAGATMWSDINPRCEQYIKNGMHDFRYVTMEEVAREFADSNKLIADLQPDVVITHHAPSLKSLAEKYKRNLSLAVYNSAFVSDCNIPRSVELWIHGHTHSTFDYVQDGTRIICNPTGYPGECFGRFDKELLVEI